MTRRSDWNARLGHVLAQAARKPFRPGSHDCGLFVADAVVAMTDHDPVAWLRGRYRTLEAAQEMIRAAGHADHVALFAAAFPEIPPARAGVGDLAVVMNEAGEPVLGVVQGERIALLRVSGLGFRPRTDAVRAFKV